MASYTSDYLAAAAAAVQRNSMPKGYSPYGPWEYPNLEYNPYMPELFGYEQALIPPALAQAFALPFCDFQLMNPDPNMFSLQQQQMLQNLQNAQQGLRPTLPQAGFQGGMGPTGLSVPGMQPSLQQNVPGLRFMPGTMPPDSAFTANPVSSALASSSSVPNKLEQDLAAAVNNSVPPPTMSSMGFPTPQGAPPSLLSLPPGYPASYPYPNQNQMPYFRDPTLGMTPGAYGFPGQTAPFPQGLDYPNMTKPSDTAPHHKTDDDDGGDELTARALKRPRLVWTPQLHKKFEESVNKLGVDKAVPKTIMQLMNIEGLTRENVASHLQKYRLHLKKQEQPEDREPGEEQKSPQSSHSKD